MSEIVLEAIMLILAGLIGYAAANIKRKPKLQRDKRGRFVKRK